jgi:hypothetical protein
VKVFELDQMSIKELRALRDLVDQAINTAIPRERFELRAKFSALALASGLTLEDIIGGELPE